MKISLAMIIKNEEKYIEKCLASVSDLVDEIVLVDTGSTDNTLDILRLFPEVFIYHYKWDNNFASARNFAIDKCQGDYILVLDADEYITEGSRKVLEEIGSNHQIGKLKQENIFEKDGNVFTSSIYISRFFPNSIRYKGAIHEQLVSNLPRKEMKITVFHYGYLHKGKNTRNIPLLLKELSNNPDDPYYYYQLGKEYRIMKDFSKAITCLRKSYHLISDNDPFYNQVILELLQIGKELTDKDTFSVIQENEQRLNNVTDFHFYKGLFYLDFCLKHLNEAIHLLPKIEESFTACLDISKRKHIEYLRGTGSFLALYNLGVYHEVMGSIDNAQRYYMESARLGYEPAKKRLAVI